MGAKRLSLSIGSNSFFFKVESMYIALFSKASTLALAVFFKDMGNMDSCVEAGTMNFSNLRIQ
jgi:hypothetical protein